MAEIIDFHTHFLPRLYAQALKSIFLAIRMVGQRQAGMNISRSLL